jgi:hypothetical protein
MLLRLKFIDADQERPKIAIKENSKITPIIIDTTRIYRPASSLKKLFLVSEKEATIKAATKRITIKMYK